MQAPPKHSPLVSVLIITYNQAHFLPETLQSALTQDYENLEVIIADDASTDDSKRIISEYQLRYPGKLVPVFNPVNLGITGNCNAGLAKCRGELIAFLGGDDLFLPHKVRKQVELFVEDPQVVLSYHPVEIFHSASGKVIDRTNQLRREDTNTATEILLKCGIPGQSSVMVRRSACPAAGFDCRLPTVSDCLFCFEVAMNGKVAKLDGVYARYRKHGNAATDRTFELLEEILQTFDIASDKFPEEDILKACQLGKARFLAGEGCKQLVKDPDLSQQLFLRAISLHPSWKYKLLRRVSQHRKLSRHFGSILLDWKHTVKRYCS